MSRDTDVEFQNEKEWRRYQIKRLNEIENKFDSKMDQLQSRMTALEILGATLKLKVGLVSSFFGAMAGYIAQLFLKQ
jgi:hypothetical protein